MAEHYNNTPRITYEFPDCSMPMAFDTYNNCSFGCMYCFAQNQRGIGSKKKEYLHKEVKDVSVERIKRMFIDPDKHGGDFAPYIKDRKVMQWGSMSDQFDNFERKYGTTLELLRFFKDIDYPLCFSTKGAWFTKDERYMDLIRGQKNWNFKFSIITSDAEKARVIERGVESPQARLEAIERTRHTRCSKGQWYQLTNETARGTSCTSTMERNFKIRIVCHKVITTNIERRKSTSKTACRLSHHYTARDGRSEKSRQRFANGSTDRNTIKRTATFSGY